jgi:hypothetical protein
VFTADCCKALINAKLNSQYDPIFGATRLLTFFATPHRGSKLADMGSIVAKIATMSHTLKNDLFNVLKKDSKDATQIFKDSRHILDKCLVINFFETVPYGKLGIVCLRLNPFIKGQSNMYTRLLTKILPP